MEAIVKPLKAEHYPEAVDLYTEAFSADPLFIFAFPEKAQRLRLTRIMYEFVVYEMVTKLDLVLKGAFIGNTLTGCVIYTTPDSSGWNDSMNEAIDKMRKKARDERINLIGEYARLNKYSTDVEHFYGNELAVGADYRMHGIGKLLNDSMVDECMKHRSARGIIIDTANEKNVKTYLKWGWQLKTSGMFYDIKYFAFWLPVK